MKFCNLNRLVYPLIDKKSILRINSSLQKVLVRFKVFKKMNRVKDNYGTHKKFMDIVKS